jgi:hypothetical protein
MKKNIAPWVAVVCAVLIVLAVLGISVSSQGAAPGKRGPGDPVTTPIATPPPTVNPDVAEEMNGPKGQVTMAGKIKMHAPQKGLTKLAGNGEGNGCQKHYGSPGQCLPLLSPSQQAMPDMDHPWTCPEVRTLFPEGIAVRGKDSLRLDTNSDRIACGPGDG